MKRVKLNVQSERVNVVCGVGVEENRRGTAEGGGRDLIPS